jgi:hypothetical protein
MNISLPASVFFPGSSLSQNSLPKNFSTSPFLPSSLLPLTSPLLPPPPTYHLPPPPTYHLPPPSYLPPTSLRHQSSKNVERERPRARVWRRSFRSLELGGGAGAWRRAAKVWSLEPNQDPRETQVSLFFFSSSSSCL